MQCKKTKHAWVKLKTIYEGVSKVKQSKIQTYKGQFESLKMKEEENIVVSRNFATGGDTTCSSTLYDTSIEQKTIAAYPFPR